MKNILTELKMTANMTKSSKNDTEFVFKVKSILKKLKKVNKKKENAFN